MPILPLNPPRGSTKKRKRIGRGPGSGHGKTATHGHKGQKARSGAKFPAHKEGGQMPLARRLPKRGFTNIFKKTFQVVNLRQLSGFKPQEVITPLVLQNRGLVSAVGRPIKILGDGRLLVPVVIQAHAFSRSAREKITASGGRCELVK